MILADDVETCLINRLSEVYPKPATYKGMAKRLAEGAPAHATKEALEALADRILAERKAKTFPDFATLLTLVKAIPATGDGKPARKAFKEEMIGGKLMRFAPWKAEERIKALDEAEKHAMGFLRGSPMAKRAIVEKWAPALIDFAIKNGRVPQYDEEEEIVAVSRRNDIDARDFQGGLVETIQGFRAAMHEAAGRRLTAEAV